HRRDGSISALVLPAPLAGNWLRGGRRPALHAGERGLEVLLHIAQDDPVLRPSWPREGCLERREIEPERVRVRSLGRARRMEEPLLLRVRLDQPELLGGASRELEIAERLLIDRE